MFPRLLDQAVKMEAKTEHIVESIRISAVFVRKHQLIYTTAK